MFHSRASNSRSNTRRSRGLRAADVVDQVRNALVMGSYTRAFPGRALPYAMYSRNMYADAKLGSSSTARLKLRESPLGAKTLGNQIDSELVRLERFQERAVIRHGSGSGPPSGWN